MSARASDQVAKGDDDLGRTHFISSMRVSQMDQDSAHVVARVMRMRSTCVLFWSVAIRCSSAVLSSILMISLDDGVAHSVYPRYLRWSGPGETT